MPGWAIYALVCAALTAVHRPLIQRIQWHAAKRNNRQLNNFVLVSAIFSGAALCILMCAMFMVYGVPGVKVTFWLWIGLAGLIQFVGLTQATAAFARGNLSRLVSLNALLPVAQTGLGWVFRREWLSHWQLLGIATVAVGMLLRPRDQEVGHSVRRVAPPDPITANWIVRTYRWTQATPGRQYAIALSTWPLYAFALKPALASIQPQTPAMPFMGSGMVMGVMAVLGMIRCVVIQRMTVRRTQQRQSLQRSMVIVIRQIWQEVANRTIITLFVMGALVVGGQQFCDLMAYANGKVAAVASLMETAIVFNLPMMWVVPRLERLVRPRANVQPEPKLGITRMTIVSAIVITAGAMLIGR